MLTNAGGAPPHIPLAHRLVAAEELVLCTLLPPHFKCALWLPLAFLSQGFLFSWGRSLCSSLSRKHNLEMQEAHAPGATTLNSEGLEALKNTSAFWPEAKQC